MNKWLAIAGSIAGAISAGVLMIGMSSVDSLADFPGCTKQAVITGATISTRDLHWRGGDAVDIKIPASVRFTAAPTWQAIATGPTEVLEHLYMDHGQLEFESTYNYCGDELRIELQGPAVTSWSMRGNGELLLKGLQQDRLDIYMAGSGSARASGNVGETQATLKGSGDVNLDDLVQQRIELAMYGSGSATARGTAELTRIAIYGSGTVNFGKLAVKSASIRIHGSGGVFIAPTDHVDAQIYGSGDVRLLSNPRQIQQRIYGSGEVVDLHG